MSKRSLSSELQEKASTKKKARRQSEKAAWREKFSKYSNLRIDRAVKNSWDEEKPIILVKDSPSSLCTYYEFWPCNVDIGLRVLNVLDCLHNYGHNEDTEEKTKACLAAQDHMSIVEALCGRQSPDRKTDYLQLYFQTAADKIGKVKEIDNFEDLPISLYFQPCYGYY